MRTVAGSTSPHVVKVIEVGEQPVPYIAMERLRGQPLGELLRAAPAHGTEVVALIEQVARA